MNVKVASIFFALICSLIFSNSANAVADKEVIGHKIALQWIKLIDDAEYIKAYEETAYIFRNAIKEEDWATLLAKVRQPLGSVKERKLEKAFFTTELPGAPSGEYVVIQFKTYFEGKEDSILETLTPALDQDGQWRISGYFIK